MTYNGLAESITLAGYVTSVETSGRGDDRPDHQGASFTIKCRSGDTIDVFVGATTEYQVLTNIDGVTRDRTVEAADEEDPTDPAAKKLCRYVTKDALVYVRGIHQEAVQCERMEARIVYLLQSSPEGPYVFEETHWWLNQTSRFVDRLLDQLFDARRNYTVEDFAKFYATNLNITGGRTNDDVQECATLSRLIYDLSSAYLLTGAERYFLGAQAAVSYQRQAFRTLTSDGRQCFWAFGRRRSTEGERLVFASEAPDDSGAIPLYEQIYALAGLAQYYRITADWEVLEDIRRTMNTFDDYFRDEANQAKPWLPGYGGYFSHLDPITMRPDTPVLGDNRSRKNWNSIGDHIPAYLVNLVLTMDPVPHGDGMAGFEQLRDRAISMLEDLVALIIDKFPDEKSEYVNERFHADWTPDHEYKWQQDRAIVGHNLKIAWNLTRCSFYLDSRAHQLREHGQGGRAQELEQRAKKCRATATDIADKMAKLGLDVLRGGVFDAVERHPDNGMPVEFAWGSTKDFWQQEQGILAYLVLYGTTGQKLYLDLARECMAFWNLFFLDRDRQGIYFRTTEGGVPVIEGIYGQKAGHSTGYHVSELNYLAHLYLRVHVAKETDDRSFCLYFHVLNNREQTSINVLPDFMPRHRVEIQRVRVNGIDRTDALKPDSVDDFRLPLDNIKANPDDGSIDLAVEFAVH